MINKTIEEKMSRFSDIISRTENTNLIDFWNEIIDDISKEEINNEIESTEFQNYLLIEKNAKLQSFIAMSKRPNSEFVSKFDAIGIFNKTPQYYDYLRKALNYEFRNKKPRKHKFITLEERKTRLLAFREKIGFGSIGFIEGGLS